MFQGVLFDLIGTTVKEKNGDTILSAFETAFLSYVDSVDLQILKKHRGKDKRAMIIAVLEHHNYSISLVEKVYRSFMENLEESLVDLSENDGAAEIFYYLKSQRIKLGIGTALERDIFQKLYNRLKWSKYKFDYIGTGTDAEKGRPHPHMIFAMMKQTGLANKASFLKVGDTIADIQEGKNAGVLTAAILSGSQQRAELEKELPDFLIESLSEVKAIVTASASQG